MICHCTSTFYLIDWENQKGMIQAQGTTEVIQSPPSSFRQLRMCEQWLPLSVCFSTLPFTLHLFQTNRLTSMTFTCLLTAMTLSVTPNLHFVSNFQLYSVFLFIFSIYRRILIWKVMSVTHSSVLGWLLSSIWLSLSSSLCGGASNGCGVSIPTEIM